MNETITTGGATTPATITCSPPLTSLGDRGSAHYLGVGLPVVGFVIAFGIFAYVANKSRR
jgi:hypothetical protein